ncbi:phosphoribosylaminoimidazole carboxylase [Aureococcus anophagefferens]|nr:phosphoribosylaminoimidazole carboxylase [Aureococcus anophagefferens]
MSQFGPSTRIGVLGGGQLGRMMIQEAVDLDARVEVMDPSAEAPCRYLTHRFVQGDLCDAAAVEAFGAGLDCLTIEIENVSTEGMEALEAARRARRAQAGARRFGRILLQGAPCVLEQKVAIAKELSVIVCRRSRDDVKAYEPTECVFDPRGNVVQLIVSPADVSDDVKARSRALATRVVDELDFVGILAVELFLDEAGEILVNEVAPRAHNSGHHTIEANATSQFAQLLRVTLDLPLGSVAPVRDAAAMVNVLGEADAPKGAPHYSGLRDALDTPGVYPHSTASRP